MTTATDLGFTHRFEPAAGGDGATLLLLHGTGGDEHDLIDVGRMLRPGAALLSPRGKVLEQGMPRFFRRLAEGVFDLEDLAARTHELADFIAAACAAYGRDPGRVFAAGFSNGANIAASLLLLRPGVLKGAALFRPMVPLVPEQQPSLAGTPVFIGAGQFDQLVPRRESERLAELLSGAGAEVTTAWQPANHGLTRQDIEQAAAWLAKHAGA
ncbi:MAG TPA: alpha/beta hydrolase [Herpetosiphonaceae bacterium]